MDNTMEVYISRYIIELFKNASDTIGIKSIDVSLDHQSIRIAYTCDRHFWIELYDLGVSVDIVDIEVFYGTVNIGWHDLDVIELFWLTYLVNVPVNLPPKRGLI